MNNTEANKTKPNILIENTVSTIDPEVKKKYIEAYGEKELTTAHVFSCIIKELTENPDPRPHVLIQIIIQFFKAINSKDPMSFHQDIARIALSELEGGEKNDTNRNHHVDFLARELCESCNRIGEKIFSVPEISLRISELNKTVTTLNLKKSAFEVVEIPLKMNKDIDQKCFTKGVFTPLHIYYKELELSGIKGRQRARELKKEKIKADYKFWFLVPPKEGEPFFFSVAFIGLAKRLWEDKISKRIGYVEKYPPCLLSKPYAAINNLMGSKKEQGETNKQVNLVKGKQLIAQINTPLIPPEFIDKVMKGAGKLNTVIGHKTLRYAISMTYRQKLEGVADFRVKTFDRGFQQLAEEMGVSHKKRIIELREIMYALKHLDVTNITENKATTGRLIDIAHFRSNSTGREDGLVLTILPTLVANGEATAKGMFLIPMATLSPPTKDIAPTQLHANLYHLQMLVIETFSTKSKELFQHKCIKIDEKEWEQLLNKANLPLKYKEKIIEGWTKDRTDEAKVLEKIDEEHFKLSEAYKEPEKFLIEQGRYKIEASKKWKRKR